MVVPLGSPAAGGSVPPSPAFGFGVGVGEELEAGWFFGLMSTVVDAVAEFDACDEVAVAVSVKCVDGRFGAASLACNSSARPALRPPTLQLDLPDDAHTENVGRTLLGLADSVILAVSPLPLVSQTQMANPTTVCGSTALTRLSVCIFRHSVPSGGGVVGVVVLVGVDVAVAEVVGDEVALADFAGPPGCGGSELVLLAGPGCGTVLGWGAAELSGLGWGRGGGLVLGLGWVLDAGDWLAVVWLAAAFACSAAPAWLPAVTVSARSTGMPAGCCALVRAADRTRALVLTLVLLDVDEQEVALAWRTPCTPVRNMLTAL